MRSGQSVMERTLTHSVQLYVQHGGRLGEMQRVVGVCRCHMRLVHIQDGSKKWGHRVLLVHIFKTPEPICMFVGTLQRRFVLNRSLWSVLHKFIVADKWRHLAIKTTTTCFFQLHNWPRSLHSNGLFFKINALIRTIFVIVRRLDILNFELQFYQLLNKKWCHLAKANNSLFIPPL